MRSLPAAILVLVEADNYIKNNLLLEAAFAGVHTTRIIFWTKVKRMLLFCALIGWYLDAMAGALV